MTARYIPSRSRLGGNAYAAYGLHFATENSVDLSGMAWVSKSWVGLHCAGIACLFDNSTDNYPGVDVPFGNITAGATGTAVSCHSDGTNWEHQCRGTVPIAAGKSRIRNSAYDPEGKGGFVTVSIMN